MPRLVVIRATKSRDVIPSRKTAQKQTFQSSRRYRDLCDLSAEMLKAGRSGAPVSASKVRMFAMYLYMLANQQYRKTK